MSKTETPVGIGSMEGLGPLPEPAHRGPTGTGSYFDAYTADQMRAYAAAAVAAERERCAKLCEDQDTTQYPRTENGEGFSTGCAVCAGAIRGA